MSDFTDMETPINYFSTCDRVVTSALCGLFALASNHVKSSVGGAAMLGSQKGKEERSSSVAGEPGDGE